MSNELYLWGSVLFPWFTLIFLKNEEIKRYMPVALFGALATTIVGEVALALDWWQVKDAIFPFYHLAPYTYGAFPVGILWIFKFTNKRFFLFMLLNAAFDFVLTFPILNFTVQRGIIKVINITNFQLFLVSMAIAALLYVYQLWQEGVLLSSPNRDLAHSIIIQPATTKPLPKFRNDEADKE